MSHWIPEFLFNQTNNRSVCFFHGSTCPNKKDKVTIAKENFEIQVGPSQKRNPTHNVKCCAQMIHLLEKPKDALSPLLEVFDYQQNNKRLFDNIRELQESISDDPKNAAGYSLKQFPELQYRNYTFKLKWIPTNHKKITFIKIEPVDKPVQWDSKESMELRQNIVCALL